MSLSPGGAFLPPQKGDDDGKQGITDGKSTSKMFYFPARKGIARCLVSDGVIVPSRLGMTLNGRREESPAVRVGLAHLYEMFPKVYLRDLLFKCTYIIKFYE